MKDHFLRLFRYTRWADGEIVEALEAADERAVSSRTLRLLGHIGRARQVWLGRVQGHAELPDIWGDDPLPEGRRRVESSSAAWMRYLADCAPGTFEDPIGYQNSKGTSFENTLAEICTHVVNHSTHHRAQIAGLLSEAGHTPPATDYIFWAR